MDSRTVYYRMGVQQQFRVPPWRSSLSIRMPGFIPSPVHEGFVVDKVALKQDSLRVFVFPCQYHSTIAPYSFIRLPPTLYNVFLPVLQFSPVSIIPPLLHTHLPPTMCNIFLPVLQFSPASIIPPMLHTHSSTTHAV